MTDYERQALLIRYESLVQKIRLRSKDVFHKEMIDAMDKIIGRFINSENLTDLRRRTETTRAIVDTLDPAFIHLGVNLLEDMTKIAGGTSKFGAGIYQMTPIDKAYKFTKKTLINNYELGDLLHSNHKDAVKRFKMHIARGITEGKSPVLVQEEIKKSGEKIYEWVSDIVVGGAIKKAQTDAMYDTFHHLEKEDWFEGYEWLATLELNTCQVCAKLDGKKWKTLEDVPPLPAHFRCRCTLVPLTGLEDGTEKRASIKYEKVGREIKAEGKQVDAGVKYDDWLESQPDEVRRAVKSRKQITYKQFKKLMRKDAIYEK